MHKRAILQITLLNVLILVIQYYNVYHTRPDFWIFFTSAANVPILFELVILFVVFYIVSIKKDVRKVYILTSIFLFSNIIFGIITLLDFVIKLNNQLYQTIAILCSYLICALLILWILARQDIKKLILFYYLLVGISFVKMLFNVFVRDIEQEAPILPLSATQYIGDNNESRNIYILLFDGYPSSTVLNTYYKLPNTAIDNFLVKSGYSICYSSKSNYIYTDQSVPSFLNGSFVKSKMPIDESIKLVQGADLFKSAISKGFHVYCYTFFTNQNSDSKAILESDFRQPLSNFSARFVVPIVLNLFFHIDTDMKTDIERYNVSALRFLTDSVSGSTMAHKFVFIHFYTPHFCPTISYVFDPDVSKDLIKDANAYIVKTVNAIATSDSNAAVILMSDHGFRDDFLPERAKYNNLLAFKNINIDTSDISRNGIVHLSKYLLPAGSN